MTDAQFSSEGAVPDVASVSTDGVDVEPGQTASEQAFGDKPTAPSGQIDGGMYEPDEYQAACTAAGTPDKWDPKYERGHTSAQQWVQPYDGRYDMAFELKAGQSASQAVRDFVAGPTIADYRVIGVAIEMDELRDELGDQTFDQTFGSSDAQVDARIPGSARLRITADMYTIPFADQMRALVAGNDAVDKADEPEEPAVEARVEEKPEEQAVTSEPSPEMLADELGVRREQEFA